MKLEFIFAATVSVLMMSGIAASAACVSQDATSFADGDIALKLGGSSGGQIGPRSTMQDYWLEEGTVIYNRTSKQLQFCDGADWVDVQSGGAPAESNTGAACSSITFIWGDNNNCSAYKSSEPHGYLFNATQTHVQKSCEDSRSWGGTKQFKCVDGEWIAQNEGSCTEEWRYKNGGASCYGR